jgi:hypothetical protein
MYCYVIARKSLIIARLEILGSFDLLIYYAAIHKTRALTVAEKGQAITPPIKHSTLFLAGLDFSSPLGTYSEGLDTYHLRPQIAGSWCSARSSKLWGVNSGVHYICLA